MTRGGLLTEDRRKSSHRWPNKQMFFYQKAKGRFLKDRWVLLQKTKFSSPRKLDYLLLEDIYIKRSSPRISDGLLLGAVCLLIGQMDFSQKKRWTSLRKSDGLSLGDQRGTSPRKPGGLLLEYQMIFCQQTRESSHTSQEDCNRLQRPIKFYRKIFIVLKGLLNFTRLEYFIKIFSQASENCKKNYRNISIGLSGL